MKPAEQSKSRDRTCFELANDRLRLQGGPTLTRSCRSKQYFCQPRRSTNNSAGKTEIILVVNGQRGLGPAGSTDAVVEFAAGLGIKSKLDETPVNCDVVTSRIDDPLRSLRERKRQQFAKIQVYIQNLLRRSDRARDAVWKPDLSSVKAWLPVRNRRRDRVHHELIGRLSHTINGKGTLRFLHRQLKWSD